MNSRYKGITVLIVVVALVHVYSGVGLAVTDPRTEGLPLMGVLMSEGNNPVVVNGNATPSGTSILSGATIKTPEGGVAKIQIGSLGIVRVAPGSLFNLEFDPSGRIRMNVTSGCMVLETAKGTTGEVVSAKGLVGKTDPNAAGVVSTCSDDAGVPAAPAPQLPSTVSGWNTFGLVTFGGLVTTAVVFTLTRGDDMSPSS